MCKKTKILIIDDEEIVRLSFVRILEGDQCMVSVAHNGKDAINLMHNQSFDVVLLDIRMPEMNGMLVLREIKSNWPDCEVIIITGYPEIESAKEAILLGAYDYLPKPIGPEEVINATAKASLNKQWSMKKSIIPSFSISNEVMANGNFAQATN